MDVRAEEAGAPCILHQGEIISAGELVIAYEDFRHMTPVRVQPPGVFNNRHGSFEHSSMLGMRYGERMLPRGGGKSIQLLPPTPELWTSSLPHRTQILYMADMSMIVLQLDLFPGKRVIEAGTGSGSLSHAIARAVGERGHLFTYEFNANRAELAAAEFNANGLAHRVTCRHADVCDAGKSLPRSLSSHCLHFLRCTLCAFLTPHSAHFSRPNLLPVYHAPNVFPMYHTQICRSLTPQFAHF